MVIDDCVLFTKNAASTVLNINSATNGRFVGINFSGPGVHVMLALNAGFSNCNIFIGCTFHPGAQAPVQGSGVGYRLL